MRLSRVIKIILTQYLLTYLILMYTVSAASSNPAVYRSSASAAMDCLMFVFNCLFTLFKSDSAGSGTCDHKCMGQFGYTGTD